MERSSKERLDYIDFLKGIAIIFVVIGHLIQNNVIGFKSNTLFCFIYSFHMPFFMFLSGYIAYKTTIANSIFKNYPRFIGKKAITLLLPYFSWALIISPFFFREINGYNFKTLALQKITDIGSGLWFLPFLFIFYLSFSFFLFIREKIFTNRSAFIDIILVVIMFFILAAPKFCGGPKWIQSLLLYYLFFYLGIFFAKFSIFNLLNRIEQISYTFLFSLFVISSGFYKFEDNSLLNLLLKLMASIGGICSFYFLSNKLPKNIVYRYICLIGKYSLVIYVTHFSFLRLGQIEQYLSSLNFALLFFFTLCMALGIIVMCLALFKVVRFSTALNYFFYGNHKDFTLVIRKKQTED